MQIYKSLQIAKEMGVDPVFAMNARRRYLSSELWKIEGNIARWIGYDWCDGWDIALFVCSMRYLHGLKNRVKKELSNIDRLIFERKNEITDEMIEAARNFPMEMVIEFVRGKVRCINPTHDDKHPSAYYASRTNRLMCPVCNKSWDTIAVYQHIHGVDFSTAIKGLR